MVIRYSQDCRAFDDMSGLSPYEALKQRFSRICATQEQLQEIKYVFRNEINSPRLFVRIITPHDLLYTLEQRDCLSEDNIDFFYKISEIQSYNVLTEELKRYPLLKLGSSISGDNIYASERIADITSSRRNIDIGSTKASLINPLDYTQFESRKRDAIYKLIAGDIGRKWREFGRNLGIKEGDMDSLDCQFPRDFKSKVYGLFNLFESEEYQDPKRYVSKICESLEECRRNDLKRKVFEILARD